MARQNTNSPSSDLRGRLLQAAAQGPAEKVLELLQEGGDVNTRKNNGRTLLMIAVESNKPEIVQLLWERGAGINLQDNKGFTALMLAGQHKRSDFARLMIERGADLNLVDNKGASALSHASESGDLDTVRVLVERGALVNRVNNFGTTPLIMAAKRGHTQVVNYLLSRSAAVDHQESGGWSALLYAVDYQFPDTVQSLLEHGANPNTACKSGTTPLMLAARQGNLEMCTLLLAYGADPRQKDRSGKNAGDSARESNRPELAEFLKITFKKSSHGKKEQEPSETQASRLIESLAAFTPFPDSEAPDLSALKFGLEPAGELPGLPVFPDRNHTVSSALPPEKSVGMAEKSEAFRTFESSYFFTADTYSACHDSLDTGVDYSMDNLTPLEKKYAEKMLLAALEKGKDIRWFDGLARLQSRKALPVLRKMLAAETKEIPALCMAEAIMCIDPASPEIKKIITYFVSPESPEPIKLYALASLQLLLYRGVFAEVPRFVVNALFATLKDESALIRQEACKVLMKIHQPEESVEAGDPILDLLAGDRSHEDFDEAERLLKQKYYRAGQE